MKPSNLESWLAFWFLLAFGLPAVFVVPPIVTFDGPGHFYRAIQIGRGELRAQAISENHIGGRFGDGDVSFVDSLWMSYWRRRDFGTMGRWSALSDSSRCARGARAADLTNIAIQSPLNHLAQATGMRLASAFGAGPLGRSRAGCLLNLAAYLAVVVASLRTLPDFRRGVLLIATSPLLVIQAASLSHDAINFSIPCSAWPSPGNCARIRGGCLRAARWESRFWAASWQRSNPLPWPA